MKTNTELRQRALSASSKFLARKGYELLDQNASDDAFDLVAKMDNTLAFVSLKVREASDKGFPEEEFNRHASEVAAMNWLAEHSSDEDPNFAVRYDSISMIVLSENRAFLRYHTGISGAE